MDVILRRPSTLVYQFTYPQHEFARLPFLQSIGLSITGYDDIPIKGVLDFSTGMWSAVISSYVLCNYVRRAVQTSQLYAGYVYRLNASVPVTGG